MTHYPDIQEKCQTEIHNIIGTRDSLNLGQILNNEISKIILKSQS